MRTGHKTLKAARIELGLTTDQLASRLNVSQSTVVRNESSEAARTISLQTLNRIAAALCLRLEYKFIPDPQLASTNLERIRRMSVSEKIQRAIELSELSRELSRASKSAR